MVALYATPKSASQRQFISQLASESSTKVNRVHTHLRVPLLSTTCELRSSIGSLRPLALGCLCFASHS